MKELGWSFRNQFEPFLLYVNAQFLWFSLFLSSLVPFKATSISQFRILFYSVASDMPSDANYAVYDCTLLVFYCIICSLFYVPFSLW